MFNKDTGLKVSELDIPHVDLKVNEWIDENKMTDEQKKNDPKFHVKKGTLVVRSYKEAWLNYWNTIDNEDKDKFINLPNFDPFIFEEITGINIKDYIAENILLEENS